MEKRDFYKAFIKDSENKLVDLFNQLHDYYDERLSLFNSITSNDVLLETFGIKISIFTDMMEGRVVKRIINTKLYKYLDRSFIESVNRFIHICNVLIPKTLKNIKVVSLQCRTPEKVYDLIISILNIEIGNTILKGYVYSFGKFLGKLCIKYVTRRNTAKPVPDWGASIKLRDELISKGITVKSRENPNGKKWLLYRTDDDYCYWAWLKRTSIIANKQMYRFRSIATNNENTDYGKISVEKILKKNIGNFDKLMAILKSNPSMKEVYASK